MPRKAKKPVPRLGGTKVNLRDPDARVALPYLHSPIWETFDLNRALGYGGNKHHPGCWYAKIIVGKSPDGKEDRRQTCLGLADDLVGLPTDALAPAPGVLPVPVSAEEPPVLSYLDALAAAITWCQKETNRGPKGQSMPVASLPSGVTYRFIGDALDAYRDHLNIPDGHSRKNTFQRIEHTKAQVGHLEIATLTRNQLDHWRDEIVRTPPRIRTKPDGEPVFKKDWDPKDPDNQRARKVTANRALADVKAALNYTYGENGATSSIAWDTCKAFRKVDKSRDDFMTPAQVIHFLNACCPEFRPLAYGTLLTGGRYGELTQVLVEDFRPHQRVLHIKAKYTKTNQERYAPLTDEAVTVFREICRDRDPKEPIFIRANGLPWGKSQQHRPMKDSTNLMDIDSCFYGLRHTRISQFIEDGIDIGLVGESVGTSESMIRKHYKHLLPESVQKAVNKKSRSIGLSKQRINQSKRELKKMAKKEVDEMPVLLFTIESLHPSTYRGKIKGGREEAPAPKPKPTREELEALLAKEIPVRDIGKMFGYSGTMIARWCKAFALKVHGLGHFSKKRAQEKR